MYMNLIQKWNKAGAVLLLCAAGCAVGPRLPTARPSGAGGVAGGRTERHRHANATDMAQWWTAFKDPLLDSPGRARGQVESRSAHRRSARARGARVACRDCFGGLWPTLDVSGSYSRNRASQNALVFRGGKAGSQRSPAASFWNRISFRTVSMPIGKLIYSAAPAGASKPPKRPSKRSIEDRRSVLVTLLGDVAKNYIDLRGLQRRLAVAQDNLKAQQDTLDLTKIRFDAGLASDFDVAQAEGQVKTTEAQIPTLQTALKQTAYRIDILLGAQPGASLGRARERRADSRATAGSARRPASRSAQASAGHSQRRTPIGRRPRRKSAPPPRTFIRNFPWPGSIGLQSISASDWFSGPSRFWSIGPTISWPVFDAGRIRANIEMRNAQQEQALRSMRDPC